MKFLEGGVKIKNVDLSGAKIPRQAPKWLGSYGKSQWSKLAVYLNKSDKTIRADEYLLQQYCSAYDNYRQAYDSIVKEGIQTELFQTKASSTTGEIISKDSQGFKQNPACRLLNDSLKQLNIIGRDLGLSPKVRNEMISLKDSNDKGISIEDGINAFFKKK